MKKTYKKTAIIIPIIILVSMIICSLSYASENRIIVKKETETKIIKAYLDEEDNVVNGPYGYAVVELEYKNKNSMNPSKVRFLDENENKVNDTNGVSVVKIENGKQKRVTEISFYNDSGKLQETIDGYAIIKIKYEGEKIGSITLLSESKKKIKEPTPEMYETVNKWVTDKGRPKLQDEKMIIIRDSIDEDTMEITSDSIDENTEEAAKKSTEKENHKEETKNESNNIVWKDEDGKILDQKEYSKGDSEPTTDVVPNKKGTTAAAYKFIGWKEESNSETTKIYVAEYETIPQGKKVIIWLNGDNTILDIKSYDINTSKPETQKEPEKKSDENEYDFVGWDTGEVKEDWTIYRPIFSKKTPEMSQEETSTPEPDQSETATAEPTETPQPEPEKTDNEQPADQQKLIIKKETRDTEDGLLVVERYYNQSDYSAAIGKEGYAYRELTMKDGKIASEKWYGLNNEPVPIKNDTYYKVEYTYDKQGNINREKYYDKDNNPTLCKDGYSIVYREYNVLNQVTYEKYYGTNGFSIQQADGSVSHRYEYDTDGNIVKVEKYDVNDILIE